MANMIPPLNAWYFQDVVPLVFGDDISPLEMVAKLRWYVKTLIDAVNAINEDLSMVHTTINNIIQNLDNVKNHLEQIDAKLADLESRMQAAETDIDDLQSFTQQLRTELTQAQQDIVTNANNIADNLRKIEKNAADIVAINADLNSVHTELNTHTQQISEINNAIAEINREITDIHTHLDTVDQQINDLQTLTTQHTEQIEALETRADQTDTTLADHDTRITANADKITEVDERLTPKVEKAENDIITLKGVTQSHTASIQTINSNITNINSDIADIQHDIENHNTRIDKNTDDIAELKTGETTINTTLENHETRITTLEGKVDNIPADFSELVTQVQTNTTDISTIKTEQTEQDTKITANETAIAGLDTRITSAEGSITSLDNEQDTLNLAYEEQQRHITNIETEQVTQNDRIKALEDGGGYAPTDIQEQLDSKVNKAGDTMTGALNISGTRNTTVFNPSDYETVKITSTGGDNIVYRYTINSGNNLQFTADSQNGEVENISLTAYPRATAGGGRSTIESNVDIIAPNISTAISDISTIKTVNTRQDNDINSNTTAVATHTTQIQTLQTKDDELETEVLANTGDIAKIFSKINTSQSVSPSYFSSRYTNTSGNRYFTFGIVDNFKFTSGSFTARTIVSGVLCMFQDFGYATFDIEVPIFSDAIFEDYNTATAWGFSLTNNSEIDFIIRAVRRLKSDERLVISIPLETKNKSNLQKGVYFINILFDKT